eukprot:12706562-Ditylum_brightwellii.AAC.1
MDTEEFYDESDEVQTTKHYTPPLVELSLENITYSPVTRRVASHSMLNKVKSKFRQQTKNNVEARSSNRTTILHNITTTISPYKLTAWMGPSGSGKTSLLTIATGLFSPEDLSPNSCIKVNGSSDALPKRFVGLVWQDDLLLSNLTVEETVTFAAVLKAPSQASSSSEKKVEILEIVNQTMRQLNLTKIRNSLIGGGISGGERKRVAVAVELVSRPSILLLDEPTSGLDATSAQSLIYNLKELASIGHSIVAVVHQPRTTIYQMFDKLLLLSQGRVVYNGDAVHAQRCIEACDGVRALPPMTGIADWIMDVITEDEKRAAQRHFSYSTNDDDDEEEGNKSRRQLLPTHFTKWSKEEGTVDISTDRRQLLRRLSTVKQLKSAPKFNTSFFTQLICLTRRSMKQTRGDRLTTVNFLVTLSHIFFGTHKAIPSSYQA